MNTIILCYEKCSTCKKALQWLDARGAAYTVRPIKQEHPSAEELRLWQQKSGLPLRRFFNTSGMLYRELGLKDKLDTMTEEEQLQLLASDGMLVKRPLLVSDDKVIPGFRESEWEKLFRSLTVILSMGLTAIIFFSASASAFFVDDAISDVLPCGDRAARRPRGRELIFSQMP